MPRKFKRLLILSLGILFIVVGIIGLALPFLQGILFIAIGSILLSLYSAKFRAWAESHTRKFPKLHALVVKTESWISKLVGEV